MNTQNNNLDASSVLPLCTNSCFGHVRYIYSPTTGSTNDDARALVNAPHGTVIATDNQTAGRGRHDRNWVSPPDCGLYTSLLLHPLRPMEHAPLLGIAAAVAAIHAMQTVAGVAAQIKWPNDILLNQNKIAGILTETDLQQDGRYAVIIGLGINVNTPHTALPHRAIFPASSLSIELGHTVSRPLLLAAWLEEMTQWYQYWNKGNHAAIITAWHQYAYGHGKFLTIEQQETTTTGILQGMAEDGSLILKGTTGEIMRVISGDVLSMHPTANTAGTGQQHRSQTNATETL